ncbi:MAG: hypothetical protein WA117_21780 [Verrucomicrobiia bacterium]
MSILPTYRDIQELLKKGLTLEAQEKIMELREAALQLQEEKLTFEQRVRELEQALVIQGELVRDGNVYFRVRDGGQRDGPFCLSCWDGDRKLINVMEFAYGVRKCGRCKQP